MGEEERHDHDETGEQGEECPATPRQIARKAPAHDKGGDGHDNENRQARERMDDAMPCWIGKRCDANRVALTWISDKDAGDDQQQTEETQQHWPPNHPFA